MRRVAVVMPAFDEMANLRKLLPALTAVADSMADVSTVVHVVVQTQSSDDDIEELRALGANPVRRAPTDAFGDAVRSGIAACRPETDLVIFMDADGSHDPETIPRLVDRADDADVVIASRYVNGGGSDNGLLLRGMSRTLNLCFGVVLGLKARDLSTSFKLFHYADVQDVVLTCSNFDVVEELLYRVHRKRGSGLHIVEIPDFFRERDEGETKRQLGPFVASYLVTLARLRMRG